jgi:hypothetical protein
MAGLRRRKTTKNPLLAVSSGLKVDSLLFRGASFATRNLVIAATGFLAPLEMTDG